MTAKESLGAKADRAYSAITDIRLVWQDEEFGPEHVQHFETKEAARRAVPKGVFDWVIIGQQYGAVKVLAHGGKGKRK